jgi:hypothetical protein
MSLRISPDISPDMNPHKSGPHKSAGWGDRSQQSINKARGRDIPERIDLNIWI